MNTTTVNFQKNLKEGRLETQLKDFKPALDKHEAMSEANRCINCYDAPCIRACPTAINIPQFIGRIANDNTLGAAKTILDSNIMGLSCAQSCPTEVLCEGACVYNSLDTKPISIGKLQRFAVTEAYEKKVQFYTAGKATGKRVALIGAGPASLACAHELRKEGHAAVIYEKAQLPGGLNTYGIAPYKMKSEISLWETEQVAVLGAEFRFGKELGKDFQLADLVSEYDAVFLGLGLGQDSRIDAPGVDLPGVMGAVDFIGKMKTGSDMGWVKDLKSALIVGGGNTALDACRELKKLGVPQVVVSYRRGEEDMSGYKHEMKWARQEGVEFWFNTLPTKFVRGVAKDLKVTVQKTRLSADGKVTLGDESRDLFAGLVLMATGQAKLESLLTSVAELKFEKGRLTTDANGRTGHAKIYAGGDLANGGKEVVNAVAEGKKAAMAMNLSFLGVGQGIGKGAHRG